MPKLFSYFTHSWEDKGAHTFPKGICPKVNVIARLAYELVYYDSAVHHFNHYTTRTPPPHCNIYSVQKYDQDNHMHKTFIMFILVQESENTRNTYDSLFWFRYETFITFLSLRFFDMWRGRDTKKFLLCWLFHLTPPRAAPRPKLLVWPRRAPKIGLLRPSPNLNSLFFSNSKILGPSLPGMTSFTSPVLFSIWGFYCDICDCHIRPALAR